MRLPRPILCALLAPAAFACTTLRNAPTFPDVVYQCEDGRRFRAIMTHSSATIVLTNGRRYRLYGTMREDYARYSDGRSAFFTADRRGARLELPETIYRDCWLVED